MSKVKKTSKRSELKKHEEHAELSNDDLDGVIGGAKKTTNSLSKKATKKKTTSIKSKSGEADGFADIGLGGTNI